LSPVEDPDGASRLPLAASAGAAVAGPVRVLLVDGHRLILQALSRLLVAEAVAHTGEPMDVALVDYRLRDGTGADAARAIKARWPAARIVILAAVEDDEAVYDSVRAGADGYLTTDRAVEEVVSTVRAARDGATMLPRPMVMMIARRLAETRDREADRVPYETMTPRELEVLRALTEGLSTPEICATLSITPNTLRTHVQNIMGKLHVHSKLEAVAVALRHGIVEPPHVA
jgi:DNA-binding NarL/FixJ family response regulator